MLDHLIATKRNIAGRYMLGELSPAEREKFEEHYFNCRECAEDVRDLLAISSNSRAVLFEMPDYEEPAAAMGRRGRTGSRRFAYGARSRLTPWLRPWPCAY